MKQRHQEIAPNADQGIWQDTSKFFNKGTSGQWQNVLSDDCLRLYAAAKQEKLEPSLMQWLDHH
jgi:hypothetical protein